MPPSCRKKACRGCPFRRSNLTDINYIRDGLVVPGVRVEEIIQATKASWIGECHELEARVGCAGHVAFSQGHSDDTDLITDENEWRRLMRDARMMTDDYSYEDQLEVMLEEVEVSYAQARIKGRGYLVAEPQQPGTRHKHRQAPAGPARKHQHRVLLVDRRRIH